MKVLALNFSSRSGGQSKTDLMLNSLVAGMRNAGAEAKIVNQREKTVINCLGCYTCWTKSPGRCIHQDDMTNEMLPEWLESDIVVYGTPPYNYTMTAAMKVFLERTLPSIQPFFEIHEGRMFHPLRQKVPAAVILSVSGMPDNNHFSALSSHMKYIYESPGRKLLVEIYRPAAETMMNPFFKEKTRDILDATAQAGKELVQHMTVSSETMERITQPIVDPQFFTEMANLMWKTRISEGSSDPQAEGG